MGWLQKPGATRPHDAVLYGAAEKCDAGRGPSIPTTLTTLARERRSALDQAKWHEFVYGSVMYRAVGVWPFTPMSFAAVKRPTF